MKKVLFYVMETEQMYFAHMMMNAIDMAEAGHDVKVIFESQAVKLPGKLTKDENPMYKKMVDKDLIAGVCKGCAEVLKVLEEIEELGLPLLDDMMGHAGIRPFIEEGYEVITM